MPFWKLVMALLLGLVLPMSLALAHEPKTSSPAAQGEVPLYDDLGTLTYRITTKNDLARHIVAGRMAQAQGNTARASKEFATAASIQDSFPYMEPPYWYYPIRQSLGAALLAAGKPAEAEQAFTQSLAMMPNNGLMKAQQAQGKAAAPETEKRFKQAWTGNPGTLDLQRL
jgi:tetratricopeptide (TPR) repeat protein